jgi:transposase
VTPITPEEALAIYHAGPEAVVKTICDLSKAVCELTARVVELEERLKVSEERHQISDARIKDLEAQIAKNSRNSSKPPSSDGFNKPPKPKSRRERSGKPPGGQTGHEGHRLEPVENPDHTVHHPVDECEQCGHGLGGAPADGYEKRQTFDLPPLTLEVTEHKADIKQCGHCGHETRGQFPDGVDVLAQYGPRLRSLMVYLNTYQFIPYGRLQEFMNDVFSCSLSQGTLVHANEECAKHLEATYEQIKAHIRAGAVAHFDETGLNIQGKLSWLHVAGTEDATCYMAHAKRGREAMDAMGILPGFKGKAVHDHWDPYFGYGECEHTLCNAHHLRELVFVSEQYDQVWAQEMIDCLLDIKASVDQRKAEEVKELSATETAEFERRYDEILEKGFRENPSLPTSEDLGKKKRGRKKQSKPKNLLDRLAEDKQATLAFMCDFNVPFDNNLAERDGRMMKVQQKISGVFRSHNGVNSFCRIRSYISTARKNTVNILEAIQAAFSGAPVIPFLQAAPINGP